MAKKTSKTKPAEVVNEDWTNESREVSPETREAFKNDKKTKISLEGLTRSTFRTDLPREEQTYKDNQAYYDRLYAENGNDEAKVGAIVLAKSRDVLIDAIEEYSGDLTPKGKALSKMQQDLLKRLNKVLQDLSKINRKDVGAFRKSAHLLDQTLKYTPPANGTKQLSIFDNLLEGTKTKLITELGQKEAEAVVEGIKLSAAESKLVDCLCKMLHEKSETGNPAEEKYYTGNGKSGPVVTLGEKKVALPILAFTLFELTKEYTGGKRVTGKHQETVRDIVLRLEEKKFLISYKFTEPEEKGRTEYSAEAYQTIITTRDLKAQTFKNKKPTEGETPTKTRQQTVIILNTVFRHQIDTKFILYPNDINKRMAIAFGGPKVTPIAIALRDYLMREHSSKRYDPEISAELLYYTLAEKWMIQGRRGIVKQHVDKAIRTVTALGLIKGVDLITSKTTAKMKYVFHIEKDWK